MPIYEYKCDSCGNHYEQIRRMAEADSGLECPACKATTVERQLSSFAAHANGSPSRGEAPSGGGCGLNACAGGRCAFPNN